MLRSLTLSLLALSLATVTGCPSSGGSTGSVTRGGSDDDDGSSGGERADRGGLESPPGSRDPAEDPDDMMGGGDGGSGTGGTGATADGGGTSGGSTSGSSGESPWGSPDSESGERLPERRPMTGSALSSYREGVRLAAAGDYTAARSRFDDALDADSGAFRAAYNLGVLADRSGDATAAVNYYRQALRIQPDYERALEGIVAIFVREGRATEAVSTARPIAERWVRNLDVQAVYGRALIEAHREAEAVEVARRALRRDERHIGCLRVLIAANLSLGRTELAQSILDQALAIDANDAELQYMRARTRQTAGDLRGAIEGYRRAIELRGDYADARMALGILLLAGANYTEAVTQFEAVARLVPEEAEVHLNLGDAYRSTKNWEKAKASFDRVIAIDSRNAQVHFNLGLMYLARANEVQETDRPTALNFFNQARDEFTTYRSLMGSRLPREDQSQTYLDELARAIDRTNRAIERDRARAEREAARAAREAAEASGGGTEGSSGGE
jgi:tetratricopeptide (TPR) repeat protein